MVERGANPHSDRLEEPVTPTRTRLSAALRTAWSFVLSFEKACEEADKRIAAKKNGSRNPPPEEMKVAEVERHTLEQVHVAFRKWLGNDYDIGTLNAVLAVAASEKLFGDPAWLLIISGPGNAKTETCQSLSGLSAHIISTISSEGALLSGTSDKTRSKAATGGLLRKIGGSGTAHCRHRQHQPEYDHLRRWRPRFCERPRQHFALFLRHPCLSLTAPCHV